MLDLNVLLIQITGHPIILFGEKRLNVLNRIIHHDHFFSQHYNSINTKSTQKTKFYSKSYKFPLNFVYFSKIENRKKKYQINKKTIEHGLSRRIIESCMHYNPIVSKLESNCLTINNTPNYNKKKVFHLIFNYPGNRNLLCLQAGDIGFCSVKNLNKIYINDFEKKKTPFRLTSSLVTINLLSSHPNFQFNFLASGKKCSEFWKITPFSYKSSVNLIYHTDPPIIQKYRRRGNFIDFGTYNNIWKCFDEIAQKYTFFYQFDENIIDISTSSDNNISTICTNKHLHIFDNRISKKIAIVNADDEKYESIKLDLEHRKIFFIGNQVKSLKFDRHVYSKIEKFTLLDNYNKFNLVENKDSLFIKKGRRFMELSGFWTNYSAQFINSQKNIKCSFLSQTGSLLISLNKDNVSIFQRR